MRLALLLAAVSLAGCAAVRSSDDPCSILADDDLAEIVSSTVKTKELVGPRKMGDEVRSTCDIDFADGQWLTITVARLDKPVDDATLATFTHKNAAWSASYGFPIFYREGTKDLNAFPEPDRSVHLRMGKDAGQGYAGSFPENLTDKLRAVLVAVAE